MQTAWTPRGSEQYDKDENCRGVAKEDKTTALVMVLRELKPLIDFIGLAGVRLDVAETHSVALRPADH